MRHQRPRGSTTREAVVSAALDVVDSVGVEALTIRAVARAVGAPPMSLYTHFANKEELLDLMYAEVSRRLYPDSGQATWDAELRALGRHMRATLMQHPRWTPLLSRHAVTLVVPVRERVLKLMLESGVAAHDALPRLTTVFLVSLGLCLAELHFRNPDGSSQLTRRFERVKAELATTGAVGAVADEPTSRDAFARMGKLDLSRSFELAIDMLIAGIGVLPPSDAT